MTRDEILAKVKAYEEKWGKLGTGSIMSEPDDGSLSHSNFNKKGQKAMFDLNSEYYKYRQKVLNGKQKNKLAHAETIDINELNEQYWGNMVESKKLIHANVPKNPRRDHKYLYIDQNGRYIYEEPKANNFKNTANKAISTANKAISNVNEKNSVDAVFNDDRMKKMLDRFDEGFKSGAWKLDPDGRVNGINDDDEGYFKDMEIWMRSFKNPDGSSLFKSKEFNDKLNSEIKKRWEKYNSREAAIKKSYEKAHEGQNNYTNDEGESYSTYESKKTKKEIVGPNALKGKQLKHSMEEDVTDEYKAFMEKAKAGKERNRLCHSTVISADVLNQRYMEDLEKHSVLVHMKTKIQGPTNAAQKDTNDDYIYKIPNYYSDGRAKYFYSKEELDAFNASQTGSAKQGEAQGQGQQKYNQQQKLKQQSANQAGSANAGASQGQAQQKFLNEQKAKKLSANQAGSSKQGEAEGKGYAETQKKIKEEPKEKVTVESVVENAKKDPNFTKTVNTVKAAIDNGDISYIYDKPIVNIDKKTGKLSEAGMKADEAWKDLYKSFNDLSSKNKENGLSYEDVKGALMNAFNSELKKAKNRQNTQP